MCGIDLAGLFSAFLIRVGQFQVAAEHGAEKAALLELFADLCSQFPGEQLRCHGHLEARDRFLHGQLNAGKALPFDLVQSFLQASWKGIVKSKSNFHLVLSLRGRSFAVSQA